MEFDSFVLAAATADLGDERRAREHADLLEFRMDLADEPLSALADYDGTLPILATDRTTREGGAADDDDARLAALAAAARIDAVRAIDVELATLRTGDATVAREAARETGVAVVASAHDFEGTPDETELVATLEAACRHGDVGKLAVTATGRADALALLSATRRLAAAGETVATVAMGDPGRHTRAVAPVYGSRIGYAPVDAGAATAPGQYDLETLSRLVSTLRAGRRGDGESEC